MQSLKSPRSDYAICQSRSIRRADYGIAESGTCGPRERYYDYKLEYGGRQLGTSLRLSGWRVRSAFRQFPAGICRSTMDRDRENVRVSSLRWNRTHQAGRQDSGDTSEIKGGLPVAIQPRRLREVSHLAVRWHHQSREESALGRDQLGDTFAPERKHFIQL
jgi:hypothetical protein